MHYNELTTERGKHYFHKIQLNIVSCKIKTNVDEYTVKSNTNMKWEDDGVLQQRAQAKWKGTRVEMEENADLKTSEIL